MTHTESAAPAPLTWKRRFAALGPGLLFAGAAVGVSHLVQATRAGAVYGLGLLGLVLLANLLKYPAFLFGPWYTAATGTSLLEGYRRQGRWALVLYGLVTVGTMFTVSAAVTVVTAGLILAALGLPPVVFGVKTVVLLSAALLAACAVLLRAGQYRWLDRVMKGVVLTLTVLTVLATAMAVPRLFAQDWHLAPPAGAFQDPGQLLFIVGLVGWMPSAFDVSIWHSIWGLARAENDAADGTPRTLADARLDFDVGYIGTAVLSVCFLVMGAAVMHGAGAPIAKGAGGFAAQVIALYTQTLGAWAKPLIAGAAVMVMFSTTLTVTDGFPRAIAELVARFQGPATPIGVGNGTEKPAFAYWVGLLVLCFGALVVIAGFLSSLTGLVDVATALSFGTAPVLAWLNHRAIFAEAVPKAARPGTALYIFSWAGIVASFGMAMWFLVARFG